MRHLTFTSHESFELPWPEQKLAIPTFTLNAGDRVAVFGSSKARIDILLMLLGAALPKDGGLLPPLPGHIRSRTGGLDLRDLPLYVGDVQIYQDKRIHEKIGVVFSEPDKNILGRTVLEDYLNALVGVGAPPEQQIATVQLRNFGLSEKLRRRTDLLSGGEKQRLNCATAFAGTRSVLVADFTTATLDKDFRVFMSGALQQFSRVGGITVVSGLEDEGFEASRWFHLNSENGISRLSELASAPPVDDHENNFSANLHARTVGNQEIMNAEKVHRHGITQPLSVSIQAGEIVVITGPNGVGKSTFGQIVVGQIRKKEIEGELSLAPGVSPVMAPQSPTEMLLGLDLNRELPSAELRQMCGLNDADAHLDPRGFSFGRQKLITNANALRLSRGLAILDEPTSGMDNEQKGKFVELLNYFSNLAILIITHDPSVEKLGRVIELTEVSH